MATLRPPSAAELTRDVLCELANIGAGHAAAAMASLLGGGRAETGVPRFGKIGEASGLGGRRTAQVVSLGLSGPCEAQVIWLFDEAAVRRLLARLVSERSPGHERREPLAQSALLELCNVATSAFCDAWARQLGVRTILTPPQGRTAESQPAAAVLAAHGASIFVAVPVALAGGGGIDLITGFRPVEAARLVQTAGVTPDPGAVA